MLGTRLAKGRVGNYSIYCNTPAFFFTGEDQEENAKRVAWYVSLIPSLADMTLFPGSCDIWANSEVSLNNLHKLF